MFHVPEENRITHGKLGTPKDSGNNGLFMVESVKRKQNLRCVVSDGGGWEHVSVSLPDRTPIWMEMCVVKDLFWDEEDVVVQFHPKKSEYVNAHPYCLHMWRWKNRMFPTPPAVMTGPKL
ncbi:unnamed protein product [marine sediment metagenome]|uniref:DUF7694 domain-containing protein n=1 Tax=marine sediment metagenome TaxID=412755 RepID=X0VDM5_9ZZZZ